MDLILLLVFNRSHLHELVHNAFDYPFTIVLVRFLPFHPVKHLHRKEPKLHEQIFQDYDYAASILHQHYNLLVQRNPSVKNWMVRAPMVAHLRPANLRDFLVREKLSLALFVNIWIEPGT